MPEAQSPSAKPGKSKYLTVVEGFALANDLVKSRQTVAEFAHQGGVTTRMVQYWAGRARELAEKNTPNLVQVAEISQSGAIIPIPPPSQLPAAPRPQLTQDKAESATDREVVQADRCAIVMDSTRCFRWGRGGRAMSDA